LNLASKTVREISDNELPSPSPPAEKATDCQDQTGKASTGDGAWYRHRSWRPRNPHGSGHDCRTDITLRREWKSPAILREVEDFGDRERLAGREAGESPRADNELELLTGWTD
jgi:hypothetical protein